MRRGPLIGIALVAVTLVFTSAVAGKEFKPGDLRLCGGTRCVTIRDQQSLNMLASFIYTGRRPAVVRAPRLGVPYLDLRFKNGYVTGIVATARLDRFLSYGVYIERFRRGSWYAVPPRTAHALRAHAGSLAPQWLTRAAVLKSR